MASPLGTTVTEPGTGAGDPDGSGAVPVAVAGDGGTGSEPGVVVLSFVDLYLQSFAPMVRLARVLVDSPETAEDLVQDAFVHLHRRWGGVRDPRAYLHRSVVNACRSHHRRAWRERTRLPRSEGEWRPVSSRPTADRADLDVVQGAAEQGRADDADVLGAALATLAYRQRAALVLRYYADLPDAEIALALGCRPGTVASLVHRGLERLREVVDHD